MTGAILGLCAIPALAVLFGYGKPLDKREAASPAVDDSGSIQRVIARQRQLPQPVVTALQDLRLIAGVQLAYATARGGYGTAEQLKTAAFLDSKWPRSDPRFYILTCQVEPGRDGFVCHADPTAGSGGPFLRVDERQSVRWASDARPARDNPTFP